MIVKIERKDQNVLLVLSLDTSRMHVVKLDGGALTLKFYREGGLIKPGQQVGALPLNNLECIQYHEITNLIFFAHIDLISRLNPSTNVFSVLTI